MSYGSIQLSIVLLWSPSDTARRCLRQRPERPPMASLPQYQLFAFAACVPLEKLHSHPTVWALKLCCSILARDIYCLLSHTGNGLTKTCLVTYNAPPPACRRPSRSPYLGCSTSTAWRTGVRRGRSWVGGWLEHCPTATPRLSCTRWRWTRLSSSAARSGCDA